MSTIKISALDAALPSGIDNATDVIIINDGSLTKKITVHNFMSASGASIKGDLIPSSSATENTSSFNLGSETSAWKELYVSTASINFVDAAGAITKFTKADVVNLKAGKSLRTSDDKQIVHESDDKTFVQMKASAPGRVIHKVSDKSLLDMSTSSFTIGEGRVPLTLTGGNISIAGPSAFTGSFSSNGPTNITGTTNITGSTTITGSTAVTGSFNHQGSTNTLPPPLVITEEPSTNTLFYGYLFNGGNPESLQVQATNYLPSNITYFRFSTASQVTFNSLESANQDAFYTALSASASIGKFTDITFTPVAQYPSHSYKFKATSVIDSGSFYQANVSFLNSSSLPGASPAPSIIDFSGGGANGRFKFVTLPAEADEPTGGFAVGDLLQVLAGFGATGIATGSLGDFNMDGQVNVNDLLMVLSGFSNPNNVCSDITYFANTNSQLIGPTIEICEGYNIIIQNGAFLTIT